MKYWFFDGSDVTGPFTVKELAQNKSFVETSLVCPENFSDDGDHWHIASAFEDLKPLFAPNTANTTGAVNPFDQEMDSLLRERSPLAIDEVPTDGPKLQIPKKPSKPGPIEEYFDHVKEEDLGDILGIPDPNDNSDLDLAHALEKQLAKTSSTRREKRELTLDEQTTEELKQAEQTHRVATATEVFATRPPVSAHAPEITATLPERTAKEDTVPSMPVVQSPTLPVLEEPARSVPSFDTPKPEPKEEEIEDLSPLPQPEPAPTEVPVEQEQKPEPRPQDQMIPNPALLRAEKVESNSVRPRLNQTEEMKNLVRKTQQANMPADNTVQMRIVMTLLTLLVIIGGLLLAVLLRPQRNQPPQAATAPAQTTIAQQLLPAQPAPVAEPAPAPSTNVFTTPNEEKALALVQNYPLSGNRGSVASYLQRIYRTHLSQGYAQTWAAEPLYKNTYVVKYQLTKTRKEPIIYVFQVDVAQGKLTGALNNIALDLVGKI